uniref:ABC transmembrane type-1 domain-containing protein n=1 Tax=Arion vulgaris TaxID=1028688 RepID=A0A0B7AIX0_9EUPU
MAAQSKLASILTPWNSTLFSAASIAAFLVYKQASRKAKKRTAAEEEEVKVVIAQHGQKKERAVVNSVFFARLGRILKILIPGVFTIESFYLAVVAISLVARTFADVWMIQNGTSIESAIIGRDAKQFKVLLLKFVYAMPTISIVNNLLKYGLNMLKLRFRIRLSTHMYDRYLKGFTFYKMSNLDNRIANADQLLTQDTEKFCDSVAELYSNLSKPILDVILYTVKLTGAIGIMGPTYMLLYLAVSGLLLTRLRRPVGRMTMIEQNWKESTDMSTQGSSQTVRKLHSTKETVEKNSLSLDPLINLLIISVTLFTSEFRWDLLITLLQNILQLW